MCYYFCLKQWQIPAEVEPARLTETQLEAIVNGRRYGMSLAEFSRQFSVAKSTIAQLMRCYRTQRDVLKKRQPGRARCITQVSDRNVLRVSRIYLRRTATNNSRLVTSPLKHSTSLLTIRRRLQHGGLHGQRHVKKRFIFAKNRRTRITWAHTHISWTPQMFRT